MRKPHIYTENLQNKELALQDNCPIIYLFREAYRIIVYFLPVELFLQLKLLVTV